MALFKYNNICGHGLFTVDGTRWGKSNLPRPDRSSWTRRSTDAIPITITTVPRWWIPIISIPTTRRWRSPWWRRPSHRWRGSISASTWSSVPSTATSSSTIGGHFSSCFATWQLHSNSSSTDRSENNGMSTKLEIRPLLSNLLSVQSSARVPCIPRIFEHDKCKSRWIACNPDIGQWSIISESFFELVSCSVVPQLADIHFAVQRTVVSWSSITHSVGWDTIQSVVEMSKMETSGRCRQKMKQEKDVSDRVLVQLAPLPLFLSQLLTCKNVPLQSMNYWRVFSDQCQW